MVKKASWLFARVYKSKENVLLAGVCFEIPSFLLTRMIGVWKCSCILQIAPLVLHLVVGGGGPVVVYFYTKGVHTMNMEALHLNSPSSKESQTPPSTISNQVAVLLPITRISDNWRKMRKTSTSATLCFAPQEGEPPRFTREPWLVWR